jgi:acetyl esterase/lipase
MKLTVFLIFVFIVFQGCVPTQKDISEYISEKGSEVDDSKTAIENDSDNFDVDDDDDDDKIQIDDDQLIYPDNEDDNDPYETNDLEADDSDNGSEVPDFPPSDPSPIDLEEINARFYQDIEYGENERNLFDIFIPESVSPTPLVIFFHGGGFVGGDKSEIYEMGGPYIIRGLLRNGVSFASVNYRLFENPEKEGVIKPLMDAKRALQVIRSKSESLFLDKEKIVVCGASAGAGISLWIGLNDEMADSESYDPIERESTRVAAVGAFETQATYDIVKWETELYEPFGITIQMLINLGFGNMVYQMYGISTKEELYSPEIEEYRRKVDMLSLFSPDDPPIYVENNYNDAGRPWDFYALLHHPFHAEALMEEAEANGVEGVFWIPALEISDPSDERFVDFAIRNLKQ